MAKINKHIEIVGSSTGAIILSKKSYEMISMVLSKHYTHVGVSIVNNKDVLDLLISKRPDLVFLGAKRIPATDHEGGQGNYIWLSDFLDRMNIRYTGSTAHAHQLDHFKDRAKDVVRKAGLDTSNYFVTSRDTLMLESELTLEFPLFIKPPRLGGGLGIGPDSVVRNFDEFTKKVASLNDDYQSNSLVEEFLPGREFTVAVLQTADRSALQILPIEMLPKRNVLGDRVIDRAMKASKEETAVAAVAEGTVKDVVMSLAKAVFIAIGARDYGRIDIRLDKNGTPCFLEANLIPSIINGSGNFQKACLINIGLEYEPMLLRITELALART